MARRLGIVVLMLATVASCTGGSDQSGSRTSRTTAPPVPAGSISDAEAYRVCRIAIFEVEDGLSPVVKDSVEWPDLDSGRVTVQRGDGTITVLISDVLINYKGMRTRNQISCNPYRTETGDWTAGGRLTDAKASS